MKDLSILFQEEETLHLSEFSSYTAWELGKMAVERAMERNLPVVINIDRYGQPLFHAALEGTGPDNVLWIEGKKRIVYHFGHSSYYMSRLLHNNNKSLKQHYHLDPDKYRLKGGAFPLYIKKAGLIGVLTVSGLKDYEDHDFTVEILRDYIEIEKGFRETGIL